jgi:hypothetical protein
VLQAAQVVASGAPRAVEKVPAEQDVQLASSVAPVPV